MISRWVAIRRTSAAWRRIRTDGVWRPGVTIAMSAQRYHFLSGVSLEMIEVDESVTVLLFVIVYENVIDVRFPAKRLGSSNNLCCLP